MIKYNLFVWICLVFVSCFGISNAMNKNKKINWPNSKNEHKIEIYKFRKIYSFQSNNEQIFFYPKEKQLNYQLIVQYLQNNTSKNN